MPRYMLLLYDDPSTFATMSPADMQQIIEKYMAWGDKLRTAGVLLAGDKLTDQPGKVLRGGSEARVTDGPYSETKEVLGGYYLLQADSSDHAVSLAGDCPHLGYGGTIEVRQIDEMGGEPGSSPGVG